MTIVFDLGDFWIDSIFIPRASRPANLNTTVNVDLIKGGHLVGFATSIDSVVAVADMALFNILARNADNSEFEYGDEITAFTLTFANGSGSALSIGAQVIVLMRR